MWKPAYIAPGFEREILEGLRRTVQGFPAGTAELEIGTPPAAPKERFPSFLVLPANPRSARIHGTVMDGGVIELTVGQAARKELWPIPRDGGEKFVQEQFFGVCRAVFTTSFFEELRRDRNGRIVYSKLILTVNGTQMVLGSDFIFQRLLRRTQKEIHEYEPYY